MFHKYPYTDYHELNLDYIMKLCRENVGLHLNVLGDNLRLVNDNGDVVSSVTVSYAEKALSDKNGKDIDTYIFSAGTSGDTIVFTHGDNTISSITVPYAVKAENDIQGKDILDYVYNVQVAGDKLRVTKGDATIAELTVPYAVKATTDKNGKDITTYGAALAAEGNKITLRDSTGTLINEITVPYATNAGLADEATHAIDADDALHADEADHADDADNADLATLATNCTNAVQSVAVSGDNIVFTTYGGSTFNITSPYSIKAQKDDLGNVIKTTYIANVTQNSGTGKLSFLDALGNTVVELTPIAGSAINDSYGNLIADFIKSITVTAGSNYVTVTHGTGTVDTITIDYATRAWKDTNGNVIKNTYVKNMECIEDVDDGHWKLVAYNGDTPQAELFRFEVYAYAAQCDVNGKLLTSYVADVDYNASKAIVVKDGANNTLKTLANKVANIADVTLTSPADGEVLTYDSNSTKWINKALPANYYVMTCSDSSHAMTSWTDWQAGGTTLSTPNLYDAKGNPVADWSVLTPKDTIYFEFTSDGTIFNTFRLANVDDDPGYGSISYQFEFVGTEAGAIPDSYAYIVRIGLFDGNITTKKGYRVLLKNSGGGGGSSVTTYYLYNEWGSAATFSSLGTASNCVLKDSNSANVNISTLNTAFTAGTVYVQDADGAKTRVITVGYTSGSIRYFYMLMPMSVSGAKLRCCDWQTNKYQMYDVSL